jgi:beta-N-acetylhexosaminidase
MDRPHGHQPAELRRLALATVFPGFDGTTPPAWLLELAAEGLGGAVLFGRNVDPDGGDDAVREMTGRLHDAGPNLLVAVDEEGGDVTRLDVATGSTFPGSAALGAVDDVDLTRDVATALGARLRGVGVDLNLGPVADLELDPRNPIVGVRAFGAEAELVARHVAAFVAGQQSAGVGAAVKHFPGHGATDEDSHVTVPTVTSSRELLEARELVPFRAALEAGTQVVMTAHILLPALDPDLPATLSPALVDGLLRRELGFDGVVMTDGMDMYAISRTVGHEEGAVLALLAGVDALCLGGDSSDRDLVERVVAAVVRAVNEGRLPYGRLAEAAERLARLVAWSRRPVPPVPVDDEAGRRAAARAIVSGGRVALTADPLVLELEDEPSIAAGQVPWGVGTPLRRRWPGTVVVTVHEDGPDPVRVAASHAARPLVVALRAARRRAWQREAVAALRARWPDLVVVDHDLPSGPEVLGDRYVLTYGSSLVGAEAAADLLTAGRGAGGPAGTARTAAAPA